MKIETNNSHHKNSTRVAIKYEIIFPLFTYFAPFKHSLKVF